MAEAAIPGGAFSFWVEIQGTISGAFRECTGLGSESEVVADPGSGPKGGDALQKIPGRLKWTNIVLKRGVTASMEIWNWRKLVEDGKTTESFRNGSIIMYDANNTQEEMARWNFEKAWPSKITGPVFNAATNEIGIEELEIVHHRLTRVK